MAVGQITTNTVHKPKATILTADNTDISNHRWVHPALSPSHDPLKGRRLQANAPIQTGELLMIDVPYAVVPVVDDPESSNDLLCSNPSCRQKVPLHARVVCPNQCLTEVVWCNESCRQAGKQLHDFECAWLKKYTTTLRKDEGEYFFGVLWMIVRVIAARYFEQRQSSYTSSGNQHFASGYKAMQELCDNRGLWPEQETLDWKILAEKYLCSEESPLPDKLSLEESLNLLCQQESNSFGLYPRETGRLPEPGVPFRSVEQYAAAIYPAASLANHSCFPNIVRKPDQYGRMTFTAMRDIAAGEECCISYFALNETVEFSERQRYLLSRFYFGCLCERCEREKPSEEEIWGALPLGFDD